ncbi:MAG TPA: shikimate dehydrogenase [Spirochaetota bacterium]|nr:shikimate dehydrogenase [Spirochaetota bacterium]HOM37668.1 shikimate dehydrogenase [Spirochaetota bacterium]HPQ49626.1 shikimate dehydrogenase [Spirochaetota bacterium]
MITGKTNVYAVFGNPVEHSLSPVIHNYGFEKLGIDSIYIAFKPKDAKIIADSIRGLGIKGASITIPFKIDIMKHIDYIDPIAKKIGAVNTLINENDKISGFNTDGIGAIKAIEEITELKDKRVVILGYGGSARAISFTLIDKVKSLCIAGRDRLKAKELIDDLNSINQTYFSYLDNIPEYDIMINTTPLGMKGEIPVENKFIIENSIVFDIVYKPKDTRLIMEAKNKNCKIVYGYKMLLYQAIEQFRIWTGKNIPNTVENILINNLY